MTHPTCHDITCIHHTDAERTEAYKKCPVCVQRELAAAFAATSQGSSEKAYNLALKLSRAQENNKNYAERVSGLEKERDFMTEKWNELCAQDDRLRSALEEFRDSVLNGRHQLESVLDNDQTNAVLGLFDDSLLSQSFQAEQWEWVKQTFPGEKPEGVLRHLREEVLELTENPSDPKELADCFLLIQCMASHAGIDLIQAARAKFEECKLRKWKLIEGRGYRTEADA